MLNDPFNAFNSIEEDRLQVFQCQALPYGFYNDDNLFNRLKRPVLHLVLHHSKGPKAARTHVWRIRWMDNTFKLRIRDFVSDLPTIMTHGIVHVDKNYPCQCSKQIHIFSRIKSDKILYIIYFWVNRSPDVNAFNVIRLTPLKELSI
jgi:hypothetical protein